jgi:hypothetical protein
VRVFVETEERGGRHGDESGAGENRHGELG